MALLFVGTSPTTRDARLLHLSTLHLLCCCACLNLAWSMTRCWLTRGSWLPRALACLRCAELVLAVAVQAARLLSHPCTTLPPHRALQAANELVVLSVRWGIGVSLHENCLCHLLLICT